MSWNEYILTEFPETAFSRINILFDPQAIVADEAVFAELDRRGYLIQDFSDTISLRYTYESKVRNRLDAKWLILVRDERTTRNDLPYDIVRQAREVHFSLEALFPNLNFDSINSLDRKYFSKLFDTKENVPCEIQSRSQSCEFILERLFSISTDIINAQEDLLKLLFDVHFVLAIHSPVLLEYLVSKIAAKRQFKDWDVVELFKSPENFALFLGERLQCYLDGSQRSDWQIKGPGQLDFASSELKKYVSSIFASGCLQTGTDVEQLQRLVQYLSGANASSAFATALNTIASKIDDQIPSINATYQNWLNIAGDWAELTALAYSTKSIPATYDDLQKKLNTAFGEWLTDHYHLLVSLPSNPPVMLHQIIRSEQRKFSDGGVHRFALIVMDGLSLNQWAAIRPDLLDDFSISTNACFAWIPTLTSISRQSIFAGKIPAAFSPSIATTAKEESLWQQAWGSSGISKTEILYAKKLGSGSAQDILNQISPRTKICGFVIDMADNIMHGMQLGNSGMHNQLRQWMSGGYLKHLLAGLTDMGFDIILTSDHGNIECTGIGRPQDGVLSEQHGERVRIYPNKELTAQTLHKIPQTFELNPVGLPSNMYPVSLPYNHAFVPAGIRLVAHGGNSLEEVIVPMIHITSKRGQ